MPMLMICRCIVTWMLVLNRLCCSDSVNVLILLVDGCPRIDSSWTHRKRSWSGFTVVIINLVLLMDLHWLPYPQQQRITYKLCMIMFNCLRGSALAYLADYLRSAAHGDIVVPSHRTDWGLRSFAVAGPSSWNVLPVGLRSSSFGLDTFAKYLKIHLFGLAYSRQGQHFWIYITFCRVRHDDSFTKPDNYYYYYILSIILT